MDLTKGQKKFLKKNLKTLSLSEIATKLGKSEEKIKDYLKDHWREDKFEKFISNQKEAPEGKTLSFVSFSFKETFHRNWKIFAFLGVLVLAIYWNSLGNDFLSDDIPIIRDNPEIRQLNVQKDLGLWLLYFRAFTVTLTYKLFGLNPIFYRLPNIVLHLGSTWLTFILLGFFFEAPLPFFVASIFAVHPILTEAITWISGAPYSNSTFFLLLSLLFYLASNKKFSLKYWLSLFCFYLALSVSQKAVSFPFVILAYELCFNKAKENWKRIFPFFLLGGFWTIYLGGLLGTRIQTLQSSFYQQGQFYNPLTQIPIAISSYLALIFWPDGLTLYHSEMFFTPWQYAIMASVTLLFFGLILFTFIKREYRHYAFWLSFFVIPLLPVLTPFKVAWIVAERYVYMGTIGIFVFIGLGIKKIGQLIKNINLSYLILGFLVLVFSLRTVVRNADWKNQDTLWLAAARTSPSSPQNHNNLGDLYGRRGNFEKAVLEFQKAIELMPNYGDAYHNLANTYLQIGKVDLAIQNYQKALEFNPNIWQSHQNLAVIFANQGKLDLALDNLKQAININPNEPGLHASLGIFYFKLKNVKAARSELQKAVQLAPENQEFQKLLQQLP